MKKKSPPPLKKKFAFFSMQLFSADAMIFSFFFFFALKNIKKTPSKVSHNRPHAFFTARPKPAENCFTYHKMSGTNICFLICGCGPWVT